MDLRWLIIGLHAYVVISIDFYASGVSLSPISVDVWENSEVTLQCRIEQSSLQAVRWNRSGEQSAMQMIGNECKTFGFLNNKTLFSYSCSVNTFSVTLKTIPRAWHGDQWTCLDVDLHKSNAVTVFVKDPPKINLVPTEKKVLTEGDNFMHSCNFTHGNPYMTNVTWSWANQTWFKQQLTLNNISRNHAGVYKCVVSNTIVLGEGTRLDGNDSADVQLFIEYRAKLIKFFVNKSKASESLTVSENDAVDITCKIEGNPFPDGDLKFKEANYIGMRNNEVEVNASNSANQSSPNLQLITQIYAKCTDAGLYTCTGWNMLHNGSKTESKSGVALFVKCKPRMSPFHEIRDKVFSALSTDVTLSFTALAYPVPPESGFVWYKKTLDDKWETINLSSLSDNRKIISTSGLKSTLKIKTITLSDYGLYKLIVENDVGKFESIFNLTAADAKKEGVILDNAIGGTVGVVLVLLASFVAAIIIRRRLKRSKAAVQSELRDADDSQATRNISQDVAYPNLYEELQNADGANYTLLGSGNLSTYGEIPNTVDAASSLAGVGSPAVYEELQNSGFDSFYQRLSTVAVQVKTGQPNIYENLQLKDSP